MPDTAARRNRTGRRPDWFKLLVFLLCLSPLLALGLRAACDGLTANPAEFIVRNLGEWTLRFLLIGLAMTPLRRLFGWNRIARYRRMIGLYAFFYACLHLLSYLVLDQAFDWQEVYRSLLEHPYITIGMAAFLGLVPLALTSTRAMIRRLGGPGWQRLHRLVYLCASLGVLHYLLLVKADTRAPLLYGALLAVLLALRAASRIAALRRAAAPNG